MAWYILFPCSFGRTAGGISLDDEDLAFLRVTALTVGQLSIAVKGEFRLGQHVRLGLSSAFLIFADFSAQEITAFRTSKFRSK